MNATGKNWASKARADHARQANSYWRGAGFVVHTPSRASTIRETPEGAALRAARWANEDRAEQAAHREVWE